MSKSQNRDYRKIASLALIPIFFIIIEILVILDIQTVNEPPYLLLITNTIFVGLIPLYIAYLSFRTYTVHGRPGVLLLGGGMLAMGLGSIISGVVRSLPDGANLNVTIYNTAFFVGAVFAFGAALANIYHPSWLSDTRKTRTAALVYTGVVLFTLFFTGATLAELIPRFFTQDVGPTLLRQGVLISAIVLLAVSSVMFYLESIRKREDFFFWMAISLGLIAIGLLAFAQEMVVGGWVGWFGRTAEYIGALFALVAFLGVKRAASAKGIPVSQMIARFFGEAEAGYRALVEASVNAIVVFDSAYRILVWNPAAEKMFGYQTNDMVGMPVSLIGGSPDFMSFIRTVAIAPSTGKDTMAGEDRIETIARRKDGSTFPVDMTVFGQWVESTWTRTCIIRDITERKKVEEDLKASEAILHSFFNAPGAMRGIVEVVSEGDVRHITDNAGTAAFIGLTPDAMKDKLGSDLGEPADVLSLWIGHYTESMKTGKPVTFEYRDPRGESSGWLAATVSYLGTPDGGYPRFAYVVQDITERKQVDTDLRRKQAEVQVLFDNIPAGLVLFDATPPYTVIIHNRYYQELFAEPFYSQGMAGLNIYEYAPAVDAEGVTDVFDEVVLTKQPKSILDFPYKSNLPKQTWFNWYMAPIVMEDRVVALVSMSLDVTERHLMEQALRDSKAKYQALTETTSDFIWETDAQGRFTYCSPQMERLLGLKPEEMIGKTFFDLMPPDERERMLPVFTNQIASAQPFSGREIHSYDRHGNLIYMETNGVPFFHSNGALHGYRGISRDITERKRSEQALLWRKQRDEILANAGTRLLSSENPQEVINDLCRGIMEFLGCDAFFNYLVDQDQGRLHLNAYTGIPDETAREIQWLNYGGTVCGCAALDACRIVAENIATTPDPRTDLVRSFGIQAYACHPIQMGDQVIGTISFGTRSRARFTDEELAVMKSITDLIATAFHRLQIADALRQSRGSLAQSEEALRETSEYLENLFTYANAPIIVWGPQMKITRFNRAFEELTGMNEREVLGKTLEFLFPEGDREESMNLISRAMKGERMDVVELPILHRDGSVHTVLWNSATLFDSETGMMTATIAQGQDITDRKKVEEAYRKTSEFLDNLITYANAPIVVWDQEFNITHFNHAFEHLTGRNAFELIGHPLDSLFPEKTRNEILQKVVQTSTGAHWESVEIPILHRDGSVHTVLWNSATLFDSETGMMTATIAQGQDITDRKKAEEALREHADNLRRSNEDLERFAYVASHDLKEPLRMVTIFSQMLEQRYKGRLDPDADEFIQYIVEGSRKMNALISDLLEFSRVTSRGKPFVPTDMNEVLDGVLKGLSIMIQENNATIEAGALPTVSVDGPQMALVFQNLISNAIKFHDNRAPLVSVNAVRQGSEWVFSVRDNGIGIDPEYHEKIFEIFQRLQSRDTYPGTGIGLAICKRVIDRHNGRIWVESDIGKGSTFYFTIPVEQYPGMGSSASTG